MPLYLYRHIGFDWGTIGIIFAIMLLPFVLFELPLGRIADKKLGEKEILITGLCIIALSTASIPLIDTPHVLLWTALLFLTRTGASFVEIASESYFFKEVGPENSDIISFFRNTFPLSYIISPLLAISILLLVPSFKYLFTILGAVMLLGFFITLRLKDVK